MKDTFDVGDTIFMEMNFNEKLTDESGGIENSFTNYDFRLQLQCGRIDTEPPLPETLNFLELHTIVGKDSAVNLSQSGISFYIITPNYDSGTYSLESKVILKRKGLFSFGITPFEGLGNPFEINGKCDHLPVTIGSKLENDAENNFYMYQWAANPVYHTFDEKRFHDYGGYCFVVR